MLKINDKNNIGTKFVLQFVLQFELNFVILKK